MSILYTVLGFELTTFEHRSPPIAIIPIYAVGNWAQMKYLMTWPLSSENNNQHLPINETLGDFICLAKHSTSLAMVE